MAQETILPWGKLYAQGRCKAVGMPWTTEESLAVASGIPAEYVRLGIFTQAGLEKRQEEEAKAYKKSGKLPLIKHDKEELLAMAHKLNIPATSAASKEDLVKEIELKDPKAKSLVKEVAKEDKKVKEKVEKVKEEKAEKDNEVAEKLAEGVLEALEESALKPKEPKKPKKSNK